MSMVSGILSEFARRAGGVNRMQNTIGVLGGMGMAVRLQWRVKKVAAGEPPIMRQWIEVPKTD